MIDLDRRILKANERLKRLTIVGSSPDVGVQGGWDTGYAIRKERAGTGVLGACCLGSECAITSEDICGQIGGTYQGDNTDCDPNPCEECPRAFTVTFHDVEFCSDCIEDCPSLGQTCKIRDCTEPFCDNEFNEVANRYDACGTTCPCFLRVQTFSYAASEYVYEIWFFPSDHCAGPPDSQTFNKIGGIFITETGVVATGLMKAGDLWYLTAFSVLGILFYATSSSPLGPWTNQLDTCYDEVTLDIPSVEDCGTLLSFPTTVYGTGGTATVVVAEDLCGACCSSDGETAECSQTIESDCEGEGYEWMGIGTTNCAGSACDDYGACCDGDDCTLTIDEDTCSGTFLGVGTDCAPNPCL